MHGLGNGMGGVMVHVAYITVVGVNGVGGFMGRRELWCKRIMMSDWVRIVGGVQVMVRAAAGVGKVPCSS